MPLECVRLTLCGGLSALMNARRIGRAGRPGFDDSGVAVVMTSKEHQRLYEDMLRGEESVESNLQSMLVEGTRAPTAAANGTAARMAAALRCAG